MGQAVGLQRIPRIRSRLEGLNMGWTMDQPFLFVDNVEFKPNLIIMDLNYVKFGHWLLL